MKDDERQFLKLLAEKRPKQTRDGPYATTVAEEIGMHHKRCEYLLDKWGRKGWWEDGVTPRSGWLTKEGLAEASKP